MLNRFREREVVFYHKESWRKRALKLEWLGQMMASIFWIISVLFYGLNSTGDWLQLCAAFSWFIANIAAINSSD